MKNLPRFGTVLQYMSQHHKIKLPAFYRREPDNPFDGFSIRQFVDVTFCTDAFWNKLATVAAKIQHRGDRMRSFAEDRRKVLLS